MTNFDIINFDKINKKLIIMKTSDSPFDFMNEIQEQLKTIHFLGEVIIDELLHSGNNKERFIRGFFDGEKFDKSSFKFINIKRNSQIRSYICKYLKSDLENLKYSSLTKNQQILILNDYII